MIESSNKAVREGEPHLFAAGSATAAQEADDASADRFLHMWYECEHTCICACMRIWQKSCQN